MNKTKIAERGQAAINRMLSDPDASADTESDEFKADVKAISDYLELDDDVRDA